MKRRLAFAAGLAALALAGGLAWSQAAPGAQPLTGPADQPSAPPQPPPYIAPAPPPQTTQACDAPDLAYLVGKQRTEIPVPVDPNRRRVSCTTCPVTEDYRPDRTDILFDADTGVITAVKCG